MLFFDKLVILPKRIFLKIFPGKISSTPTEVVENSVECVENLIFQGKKPPILKTACGKLSEKSCQVFFENFCESLFCTNRQVFCPAKIKKQKISSHFAL